ncbi:pyridoxamine 5'-phosphate oxidase family protein [Turicibacter sanguinis]|jgi:pyridoxamine 5'-phosphate oxidase family protein|uniref:HugZ family pyridoxamine 5'-phosphate oxidase n=1 Tax=Turicibacter TaxID=191303 RepID=UPI0006C24634|nr:MULTISPECIES: pyridoxamine 5'-phosphate oxidase family protein [Turicibacter]MBP3905016.1 pyridoxamine 5'-phosphate oxidase family protein [Turicibacter sp.]MDB8437937.1 pyridoxamine 5'-phosphate oxidase family protein [Turicibacter sanguinis]MDB8458915.1 pyridoxamine 5'-phosphate oxidase family protein [Turicibacter sanguinis]MDB8555852.1 pyridoxamine 5'-phosphate oxidase family protein [Turicibacter sanguinis]MDB8558336.1 pyridoxamine 5'-phosphate oxidase family protein [Turicibacter sang
METLLNQKSLMISSLNENKMPEISYAPFMMKDQKIYIYISKAAAHYHNLVQNPQCSVMLIEDEADCKTVFARERVSFECIASKVESSKELLELFGGRQGAQMMMVLKTLDFDFFELVPLKGRLVKGFGQAFNISLNNSEFQLTQVTSIGHK